LKALLAEIGENGANLTVLMEAIFHASSHFRATGALLWVALGCYFGGIAVAAFYEG